jgi:hypothetical protein
MACDSDWSDSTLTPVSSLFISVSGKAMTACGAHLLGLELVRYYQVRVREK